MKNKKNYLLLLLVIIISIFFRFYNFYQLQYWSGDEEIASAVVRRMIVERKIALVSPNATIASSLGSFFHLISVPLFLISSLNPVFVLLFMGVYGVGTSILLFQIGKQVKDERLGFIISFLYSSSFLMGLFDRRWWPLSLNPFLTTLAIYSLLKIILNKQYFYSIFLAIAVGFAGHADPSLTVIFVATVIAFMYFKIKLLKKENLLGVVVLLMFIAPLLIFEVRHQGTIFAPLAKAFERTTTITGTKDLRLINPDMAISTFTRLFFPRPSQFAENNFCYCPLYDSPLMPNITKIITLLLILLPLYYLFKNNNSKQKSFLILLYIFISAFTIGSILFSLSYNNAFHQHYFTVIFPVIFLLAGYSIYKLTKKNNFFLYLILSLYFVINSYALVTSSFRYPLSDKNKLVLEIVKNLNNKNFSLYVTGDAYFHGGGFTGLFVLNNKHPKKSYIYPFYDWMYRSHSLYTVSPESTDQELVVIIGPSIKNIFPEQKIILRKKLHNLEGIILDNSNYWFNEKML